MRTHQHYLENCGFLNEAMCLMNPTHNTSVASAKLILESKKILAGNNNFGYVSLRYGVGAMYFGGVVFEFDIDKLVAASAKLHIEVIDKARTIETFPDRTPLGADDSIEDFFKESSVSKSIASKLRYLSNYVQQIVTRRELQQAANALLPIEDQKELPVYPDFDNFPELRVKGDMSMDSLVRVYVPSFYKKEWEDASITLPAKVVLTYVDMGSTDDELYLVKLKAEEFKSGSKESDLKKHPENVKLLKSLAEKIPKLGGLEQVKAKQEYDTLEKLIKETAARREELDKLVKQAEDEGLFVKGDRYTYDYNILSASAHQQLCAAYLSAHSRRATDVFGQQYTVVNYYGAGVTRGVDDGAFDGEEHRLVFDDSVAKLEKVDRQRPKALASADEMGSELNAYHFQRKGGVDDEEPTLIIEMGGTGGNRTRDDPANLDMFVLKVPDADTLLSAHAYVSYGFDCLFIPDALKSDEYLGVLEALRMDVIKKYKRVAIVGFCGSCIAAVKFANKYPTDVSHLILSAPPGPTPEPEKHRGAKNLFLIAWNAQQNHYQKRYNELKKVCPTASFAEILTGEMYEDSLAKNKDVYGQGYLYFGAPVNDDVRRFVYGLPIQRKGFDPLASKRNEPTVTIAETPPVAMVKPAAPKAAPPPKVAPRAPAKGSLLKDAILGRMKRIYLLKGNDKKVVKDRQLLAADFIDKHKGELPPDLAASLGKYADNPKDLPEMAVKAWKSWPF